MKKNKPCEDCVRGWHDVCKSEKCLCAMNNHAYFKNRYVFRKGEDVGVRKKNDER